jgi:hypothetical protein
MSFKLKYKTKDGTEIELDFEQVEFSPDGHFTLHAEDKTTGDFYRFIWRSRDIDPIPEDVKGPEPL